MSPPPGNRPPATDDTVTEDQVSRARANARQAIAAFEAIGVLARAEDLPPDALPPSARRSPAQEHARLARTLCALRHLADQFSGLSFGDVLDAAHEQYRLPSTGYARPTAAPRVWIADEAIGICERSITAPRPYRGSFWPPDTLSYLRGYASQHGLGFESAVAVLTTRLTADLRHYADYQGADFQQALSAGLTAHARQRLSAEGPFETGQDPAPSSQTATTVPFRPTATNQGVVISATDAEWLLVRTAARNQGREQHGVPADQRDADDQRALAEALAGARGRPAGEILNGLAPRIAARITQIEDGPATAAELGREHGRTEAPPYCDLDIDGDATALMRALGETEWMTDANHSYRVSLVIAYADAYRQAAGRGPAPAESPARIAARDFPPASPPAAQPGTPGTPDPARRRRNARQGQPRPGHRPGA